MRIINYIELYLLSTIVLYIIGPIEWKTDNTILTFFLVFVYQWALYAGYLRAERNNRIIRCSSFFSLSFFTRKYKIFAVLYLILCILRSIRISMLYGFSSVEEMLTSAFISTSSIYNAEALQLSGSNMFGGTPLSLAHMFFGPISTVIVPFTIIQFKNLNKPLAIITIVAFIVSQVINGTNEGFSHIVLYLGVGFLIKLQDGNQEKSGRRAFKLNITLAASVFLMLFAFNYVMSDRNGEFYDFSQMGNNTVDENNFFFKWFPGMKALWVWVTFYVSEGYYGMSLALNNDWTPLFGAGFSSYLCGNIEAIGHVDIVPYTLMYTNSQGWPYGVVWHTAYTWFASDVHWIGVVFIMYGMGYLLSLVYRSAVSSRDPVSVGLLLLLLMFVVFIPMNNKLFALSDTFFAFFFYLICWLKAPKRASID